MILGLDGKSSIHHQRCTAHIAAHGAGQEKYRIRNLLHLRRPSKGRHLERWVHRPRFNLLFDDGSVDKSVSPYEKPLVLWQLDWRLRLTRDRWH